MCLTKNINFFLNLKKLNTVLKLFDEETNIYFVTRQKKFEVITLLHVVNRYKNYIR